MTLESVNKKARTISVQASRDGHEYHEAWAARVALGLLLPNTNLHEISIEGHNPDRQVSTEAADVADLVEYYVDEAGNSAKIKVLQFKYYPTDPKELLRASDLTKTLAKFAKTEADYSESHGQAWCEGNLFFEFVSNRPVGPNLSAAVRCLSEGIAPPGGHVSTQVETIQSALGLEPSANTLFLRRFEIVGEGTSLTSEKHQAYRKIATWTGASDPVANLQFLSLCKLVRDKAGLDGYQNNVIRQVDVLGALGIDDVDSLYPTTPSFPSVANLIHRDCMDEIHRIVVDAQRPVLVHGPGGCGKTVVMRSLAERLSSDHVVVLFDGFGGGRWRMPGDDRHQCRRGLTYTVNCLAGMGLCDIFFPHDDDGAVLRTARKRLVQAIQSLSATVKEPWIALVLDAIDHSGMRAKALHEESFAKLLIESLLIEPIEGIVVVASCRSERRPVAIGDADLTEILVPSLTLNETRELASHHFPDIEENEVAAIHARALANPRCVDALLAGGRPFEHDGPSETARADVDASGVLDKLLSDRFDNAFHQAVVRGANPDQVSQVFHALALLPPPVPINELAEAFGMRSETVVSSFSDLFPLIENTRHGLIFRDEPTETLAINRANTHPAALEATIERLQSRQAISHYAARALPRLLLEHDKTADLYSLAFSTDFPGEKPSSIAVRELRLSRIAAATVSCAAERRLDDLFALFLEAADAAGGSERTDRLVHDFPDLVAISGDSEALRRLYDDKRHWSGSRFATLAIANLFADDWEECRRNADKAIDWLNWETKQLRRAGPLQRADRDEDWIRTIAVLLIGGNHRNSIKWIDQHEIDSAFAIFRDIIEHVFLAAQINKDAKNTLAQLCALALTDDTLPVWFYAVIYGIGGLKPRDKRKLIRRASAIDIDPTDEPAASWRRAKSEGFVDALLLMAVSAAKLGLREEAGNLIRKVQVQRPGRHDYTQLFYCDREVSRWIVYTAVGAFIARRRPGFSDIVPREIWDHVPPSVRKRGPKAVERWCESAVGRPQYQPNRRRRRLHRDDFDRMSQTIDHRGRPVLKIAEICHSLIASKKTSATFCAAVDEVESLIKSASNYPYPDSRQFLASLTILSMFPAGDAVDAFDSAAADRVSSWIETGVDGIYPHLVGLVARIARRKDCHSAALKLATYASGKFNKDTEINPRIQNLSRLARARAMGDFG